jgi:hypothetical protein
MAQNAPVKVNRNVIIEVRIPLDASKAIFTRKQDAVEANRGI